MSRKVLFAFICLMAVLTNVGAQEKSSLQQRAEAEQQAGKTGSARSLWIRAFEEYAAQGKTAQGVECGVKAAALYHNESHYQEAFDLLRNIDHAITADKEQRPADIAAWRYKVVRERMAMYLKMHRSVPAQEQLDIMERHATASADESLLNDLLYHKAIFYYTFGQDAKGNAIFREMATKLTAQKEYDKVDDVYKTLIANGRKSGSANMVAQAYSGYIAWKDSTAAIKAADERNALQEQIAAGQASIAEKESALTSRQRIIATLITVLVALAAALAVCLLVLLRFVVLTRKQKKLIRRANENIALKAKFISNISQQLSPTLGRLDARIPEVRALQDFSDHIQTLSSLVSEANGTVPLQDTPLQQFCQDIVSPLRAIVKPGVNIKMDVPAMSAKINREYVAHILTHLLTNAAAYTPEGGNIHLDFKKRGPHKQQFMVANTGSTIPKERREDVFKPFLEVRNLTDGDGLGLPICSQMAVKMNGELTIDPEFTKGTRFVLNLQL